MAVVKFDNGHWAFPEQLDHKKAQGFIYAIRRVSTGQLYFGRKNFRVVSKFAQLNGTQSDWRRYKGSSDELKALIKKHGIADFRFFVLEQYYTKGGVGWAETWYICQAECPSDHAKFLNRQIPNVKWRSTEFISSRHKDRLSKVVRL